MTASTGGQQFLLASGRGRGILITAILASSMAFLDGTITTVATARIGAQFHATFGALQWVLNGYTLPLASLILLGGSLGDRLGRRRIFLIGVMWFAVASVLCALAPTIEVLIAARGLQGVGAALMTPGSLAILSSAIVPDDRAKAVGAWSGLAGVATALGPFIGGWLVEHASWRWAFAMNLPLAVAVVVLGLRFVPESSARPEGRLDFLGVGLAVVGLGSLTWGLNEAGGGWSLAAVLATALGAGALIAFLLAQHRNAHPLVPLSLFRDRTFAGTNLMTFATYGALSALFFVLPLTLQVASGYGPLAAGIAGLPITVILLLLSARSGALATRIGPRVQLTVGPALGAVGALLLLRVHQGTISYWSDVFPGIVLFGLGMATLVAPLTAAVMAAAPPDLVGTASGVNNAVSRAAGLLAVAVLPALGGLTGDSYRHPALMVQGYRVVLIICAALLAIGGLISLLTVPGRPDLLAKDPQ
jgi:EmrB/QacA subfamily drug resistance transporter